MNTHTHTKKSTVALLLAAALLISMVSTASAQIPWYLHSGDGAPGTKIMLKHDLLNTSGNVTINATGVIWTADEAAACDVPFPAKTWTGIICRTTNTGIQNYTAYIGYYNDTNSSFHSYGDSGKVTIEDGDYCPMEYFLPKNFTIPVTEFTVQDGQWLAVRVREVDGSSDIEAVTEKTAHATSGAVVLYPESEPAWPYPELSTLVLLSVGLLALMSYVVLRKRKTQ